MNIFFIISTQVISVLDFFLQQHFYLLNEINGAILQNHKQLSYLYLSLSTFNTLVNPFKLTYLHVDRYNFDTFNL